MITKSTEKTKYAIDAQGVYLGGFAGVPIPDGAVEVLEPPADGRDKWDGEQWLSIRLIEKPEASDALYKTLDDFASSVIGNVPIDEKLSWVAKEAAAQAVTDAKATAAQKSLLKGEADLTGETEAALASVILTKAAIYRSVTSKIAGWRRATTAAIDAADTAQNPKAYDDILSKLDADIKTFAATFGGA